MKYLIWPIYLWIPLSQKTTQYRYILYSQFIVSMLLHIFRYYWQPGDNSAHINIMEYSVPNISIGLKESEGLRFPTKINWKYRALEIFSYRKRNMRLYASILKFNSKLDTKWLYTLFYILFSLYVQNYLLSIRSTTHPAQHQQLPFSTSFHRAFYDAFYLFFYTGNKCILQILANLLQVIRRILCCFTKVVIKVKNSYTYFF